MIVYEGKRTNVVVGADFDIRPLPQYVFAEMQVNSYHFYRRADMEIRPYVVYYYAAKQQFTLPRRCGAWN